LAFPPFRQIGGTPMLQSDRCPRKRNTWALREPLVSASWRSALALKRATAIVPSVRVENAQRIVCIELHSGHDFAPQGDARCVALDFARYLPDPCGAIGTGGNARRSILGDRNRSNRILKFDARANCAASGHVPHSGCTVPTAGDDDLAIPTEI